MRLFGSLAKVSGKWPSAKDANEPQMCLALTGQIGFTMNRHGIIELFPTGKART